MTLVSPSILAADFANLESEILRVDNADWLHIDVMDGVFVPNITIGAPVLSKLNKVSDIFMDVHLMIIEPHKHFDAFIKAGADLITFHIEAYAELGSAKYPFVTKQSIKTEDGEYLELRVNEAEVLEHLRALNKSGVKAALSINPGTPVEYLKPYLAELDMVLVMSVNPGFGGQSFMPMAIEKIQSLKNLAEAAGRKVGTNIEAGELAIEVDGGVAPGKIADDLSQAGANVFVAGSAIYKAVDPKAAIKALQECKGVNV